MQANSLKQNKDWTLTSNASLRMHQLMGNSTAIVGRKKTSARVGLGEVTKSSTSPPSTSTKISENHETVQWKIEILYQNISRAAEYTVVHY